MTKKEHIEELERKVKQGDKTIALQLKEIEVLEEFIDELKFKLSSSENSSKGHIAHSREQERLFKNSYARELDLLSAKLNLKTQVSKLKDELEIANNEVAIIDAESCEEVKALNQEKETLAKALEIKDKAIYKLSDALQKTVGVDMQEKLMNKEAARKAARDMADFNKDLLDVATCQIKFRILAEKNLLLALEEIAELSDDSITKGIVKVTLERHEIDKEINQKLS